MVAMRIAVPCALVLAACVARADAQAGRTVVGSQGVQMPARDRPIPIQSGTATIKGRVVDAVTGRSVARARVRLGGLPGPDQPTTDAGPDGEFAFESLPAGRYQVWAEKSGYLSGPGPGARATMRRMSRGIQLRDGETAKDVRVELSRGAVITGRIVDEHGEPVEHATVNVLRLPRSGQRTDLTRIHGGTQTNDIGEFRIARLDRGSYLLMVQSRSSHDRERQFAPTYYPASESLDDAQAIAIERGQVLEGLELTMRESSATWVSGVVVDETGKPVSRGHINVMTSVAGTSSSWSHAGTAIRPDGTFRFRLIPGSYRLDANVPASASGDGPWLTRAGLKIAVGSEPVTGIELQLGGRSSASGRLVFEGTSPLPEPGQSGISFTPRGSGMDCRMSGRTEVRSDWTFGAQDVSGTCVARAWAGGRWVLKAVTHNGVNLKDTPIEFKPGVELRDLRIVFTDRRTELSFEVNDERGLPTREFVAIAFPVERNQAEDHPGYIRTYVPPLESNAAPPVAGSPGGVPGTALPNPVSSQRPGISAMPPAEYFVVAVDDVAWEDLQDRAFLEELSNQAVRVTLGEGEARTLQLRRIRAPRPDDP